MDMPSNHRMTLLSTLITNKFLQRHHQSGCHLVWLLEVITHACNEITHRQPAILVNDAGKDRRGHLCDGIRMLLGSLLSRAVVTLSLSVTKDFFIRESRRIGLMQ